MTKIKPLGLKSYVAGALVVALVIAISATFVVRHKTADAATSNSTKTPAAVKSMFSFTGAKNWTQGPTNKTSMAVFHHPQDCFVSAEYNAGTVNVASELKKTNKKASSGGYTITKSGVLTLTMQAAGSKRQYKLYQTSTTEPVGATKLMDGNEYGFIQLANGYIDVYATCNKASQLPETIPALEAIKFNPVG